MRELVDKQLMLEDAKSWVAMDSYDQHWINNMLAWIENLPTVGVSDGDCISRRLAIDAIIDEFKRSPTLAIRAKLRLDALPPTQPTLYGYNIEHLIQIAEVLRKENLPPERVVEALTDIGRIVSIVKDEFEESLRKAVEQYKV